MPEQIPDDIVVTQVNLDQPGQENGDDIIAEAEGDIHWEGTHKRVTLKLGSALLQLTYDIEDEHSALHAAILIASAGQGLPAVDQAELEPEDGKAPDIDPDDQRFLLDQLVKDDSDYDDSLEGWLNFDTRGTDEFGRRIIKVTFEGEVDDDLPRTTLVGRWALEFIDGDEEVVTNDLPDAAELEELGREPYSGHEAEHERA